MAIVNNEPFVKTRLDSFPVTESFTLPKCIFVEIQNSDQSPNSVDVELVDSGKTARVAPGEEKPFNATTNAIEGEIKITFFGPASVNVNFTEGDSNTGGGTQEIIDLLTKKNWDYCLVDLTSPVVGVWPGFPISISEFFMEFQGIQGQTYYYSSNVANDTTELATLLNRYQKFVVFEAGSATELIIKDGLYPCRGINEWSLFHPIGPFAVQYGAGTFTTGTAPTSWGDCMARDIAKIAAILRNATAGEWENQILATGPSLGLQNVKSCSFIVLDGTVNAIVGGYDVVATPVTFPITGANGTLLGTTYTFSSPAIDVVFNTFSVGARVFIQYNQY